MIEQDNSSARQIARLLTTEAFVSGVEIAEKLGVSRAAVSEQMRKMRDAGLPVAVVKGRGYRLMRPYIALDHRQITSRLDASGERLLEGGHVLWSVDSTNRFLARQTQPELGSCRLCLAEYQTAGRGRRGRAWVSPLGASLYLSLLWHSPLEPVGLQGLSLLMGIVIAEALQSMGYDGVELKWPNDLTVGGRKLGGILMELSGSAGGPSSVVIGLGLNIGLQGAQAGDIDQPWTDLVALNPESSLQRSDIAAEIIAAMLRGIDAFSRHGTENLVERWAGFDALLDQPVTAYQLDGAIEGIARGIDETGALLLETDRGTRRFLSGEVSVRRKGQRMAGADEKP